MREIALRLLAVAAMTALAACSDDCDPADIDGTYIARTREISGDCGDMGTVVVQYDKGRATVDTGCVVDHEELSEDRCTADRTVTCANASTDLLTEAVGTVTQEPGGERAGGMLSISMETLSTGQAQCYSVYEVEYERP